MGPDPTPTLARNGPSQALGTFCRTTFCLYGWVLLGYFLASHFSPLVWLGFEAWLPHFNAPTTHPLLGTTTLVAAL